MEAKETKTTEKKVKIKMIRDYTVGTQIVKAGQIIETDEKTAEEICSRSIKVPPQFRGEREADSPEAKMQTVFMARRVE